MESRGGRGVIYTNDVKEKRGITMENPFTFKVGQVFTGFGVGCGIGIGVGRPLDLGAIPIVNQAMVATRGATDAFSGLQRHVNSALRKVGAKNIEAGIGCGVGFGHGFGVGLAVKPRVLHQIQSNLLKMASHVMMKIGLGDSPILPAPLQTEANMVKEPAHENPAVSIGPLVKSVSNSADDSNGWDGRKLVSSKEILGPKGAVVKKQYSSRTEAVLDNFLNSPLLKEETSSLREQAGPLKVEKDVLQMVLKHQVLIEELMRENEKLQQILMEELKVQPSKLQPSFSNWSKSSCTECFECRRKQRRR